MLLHALTIAVFTQGGAMQPAQDPELLLGKYTLDGQEVQAVLPTAKGSIPATAPFVAHDGWNYLLDPDGRIVDRYKADGGWSEVRLLFDEAKVVREKLPWRIKVVLFTKADMM